MKCFKYQITVTVLFYKHKMYGDIHNSDKYMLDKSFQVMLYRIDN